MRLCGNECNETHDVFLVLLKIRAVYVLAIAFAVVQVDMGTSFQGNDMGGVYNAYAVNFI